MSSILIKIKNLINYFLTSMILLGIKSLSRKKREKTLLLVRLDAIGDYILFRNFIEIIKNSSSYKNYKITLCGNIAWKSLAEEFDKEIVNDFIWIDRKTFYRNLLYKYNILKRIFKSSFETVIHITHSREILYGDVIVSAAQALNSIGSKGSEEKHALWKRKVLTDKIYTRLLDTSDKYSFEFEINKYLVGSLLGYLISIKKPEMDVSFINNPDGTKNKFILLFPGAGEKRRMWANGNFREISEFILKNFSFDITISGSVQESYLFNQIALQDFKRDVLTFLVLHFPNLPS